MCSTKARKYIVFSDTSEYAVNSSLLYQEDSEELQVIAYANKTLKGAE